jgi:AraC family transcriptional regulator
MSSPMESKLASGVHGNITASREVSGLNLTDTTFAPGLRLPKHSHENAHFCLLLQGQFTERCNNRTLECKPMSLSFLDAGETHSDHFHGPAVRCFIIDVGPSWIEHAREYGVRLYGSANYEGGLLSHLALKAHTEFCKGDKSSQLAIEGLGLELLAEASRHPNSTLDRSAPVWLIQAREMLHAHFSESLTHTQIASSVGVHPVHLAREFRRHYQCTIGEYVRRLKVEYACLQISVSDASLHQIALAAGFFDQSHFARTFKQIMGVTPGNYRRFYRSR